MAASPKWSFAFAHSQIFESQRGTSTVLLAGDSR